MRHVYLIELVLDDEYEEDEKGALRVAPKPTANDVANAIDLNLGISGRGYSIDHCAVIADWGFEHDRRPLTRSEADELKRGKS
jgi:hypothetical protein